MSNVNSSDEHLRRMWLVMADPARSWGGSSFFQAHMAARLGAVETTATEIKERLGPMEGRLLGVEGRLVNVEGRLVNVEGRLGAVEVRLGAVEGRLGTLEATTSEIKGRVTNIEVRLDTMATKEYLHRELTELSGRFHRDLTTLTWRLLKMMMSWGMALVGVTYFIARNVH